MAKTHNRLSGDMATDIMRKLRMKQIRPLWFDKFGPKMDTLLSYEQVLKEMDIPIAQLNELELYGIYKLFSSSIHALKQFAQKRKYNWVEIQIHKPNEKRSYVYYGFTTDISNIDANVERFEGYKKVFQKIDRTTKQLAEIQKREMSA